MSATASSGLLERRRELETLTGLVRLASQGSGAAALISGEAGIGKSALVAATRERAAEAGMQVLAARAGELEGEFAWGVVRQLFEGAVATSIECRLDPFAGGAALARSALGLKADAAAIDASYATLHGLYWLTVNLAQSGPLLLAVDDLHWADPPSLRFVAHLLPRISELPILLLMASRPIGSEPGPATALLARVEAEPALTVLHPAALGAAASVTLVREELASEANDEFCLACYEQSRGNPFLLRSLLVALADEGVAPDQASVERVLSLTPGAVSANVLLRLARLPKAALDLARAVAILGVPTELRPARMLAGLELDEATDVAGALIRAGILSGDTTIAFVHPLVRSAVYADLPGPERSRWHQRAARLLAEEHAPLERIAPHLVESLPDGDAWVVERLCEGAREAWARGAPEIAAGYLARALAEPPAEELRAAVLLELGQVVATFDPGEAVPHLREALACERDRLRAVIALALGDALTLSGRLGEAVRVLGTGIDAAGNGASPLRASLEAAQLSAARWEQSTQDRRHELVENLRRRARDGERLDPRLHCQLAIETTARGLDRDAAVDHARAALIAFEELPTAGATTLPEAILVLVFADHANEARERIDGWLAFARRRVWPLGVSVGSTCASLAALYRGSIGEAVAGARGAVAGNAEIQLAPITVAFLVEALIERGELEFASRELAERGLDREVPLAWATTPLLLARGRLHAAAGNHRAAISDLLAVGRRCEAWQVANPAMVPWRSSAAVSLARVGDRAGAEALACEELELARRWGAPRAIGISLRATGITQDGNEALELLREAVAVLEPSPAPLEHARALTDLGSALRRAGHRAEAREELRKGLDLAHRLGGIALADRARDELTIAGARPRRDATRGRDALTASELRVAQLAAEGLTNREIAESLFLTLRTVETHLTSSYAKLGITSRRQLVDQLAATPS